MATATLERPQTPVESSTVPDWLRLERAGAITMVVFAVALQTTARTIIPPVLVIGLVFMAFVPWLSGERRRVGLAAALFAAAAYLGNLPIILDDLSNPESAPSFILQLLSTVGVVLVIAGGIGAFTGRPTKLVRPLAVAAVAVFVVGAFGSMAIAANTESDVALPTDVVVTAQQIMWAPEDIVVDSSATGLWIENDDGIRHTFTIHELDINLEIPALKARRLDLNVPPGSYEVICEVPGHQNMIATLTVTN